MQQHMRLHDVRDRTAEFFSTVAALQKPQSSLSSSSSSTQVNRLFTNPTLPRSSSSTFPSSSLPFDDSKDSSLLLPNHPVAPIPAPSQFNVAASDIHRSLTSLTSNLDRLGRLVQKKSLFDDPTKEIEELTHLVKVDLEGIEQTVSALDGWVKREGRGGSGGKEEESKHMQTHSQVVVDNLRSMLKKKTGEFMDVLQTRTKVTAPHSWTGQRWCSA